MLYNRDIQQIGVGDFILVLKSHGEGWFRKGGFMGGFMGGLIGVFTYGRFEAICNKSM
jgi:hypothetical protein